MVKTKKWWGVDVLMMVMMMVVCECERDVCVIVVASNGVGVATNKLEDGQQLIALRHYRMPPGQPPAHRIMMMSNGHANGHKPQMLGMNCN